MRPEKYGDCRKLQFFDSLKKTGLRGCLLYTSSAVRSFNLEYGLPSNGCYFAAIVKPDIPSAWKNPDGVHAMMKHALEIVRQELGQLKCVFAAAIRREGVAVAAYLPEYQPVEVKQCFTKIRKEIEKQRDLFWGIRATIGLGRSLIHIAIAGPVLVYGISASVIYGRILFLTGGGSV